MAATQPPATKIRAAGRLRLSAAERRSVAGMAVMVIGLHVLGWVALLVLIAPHHYQAGGQVFGVGLGLTAYTLGMRHAFDADHIAAIDNTTRKLMAGGQRPLSVGFWFSLGHSSVVFGLCALLAGGVRALAGQVDNDQSGLQQTTGLIGTLVSGVFLMLIAAINLVVLAGIVRVFRQMRSGSYDEAALEHQLNNRGLMNRILGGATRGSAGRGTCTRSGCCSGSASTPLPRCRCWSWPAAPLRSRCRGTPCWCCRCCSPPACRCW